MCPGRVQMPLALSKELSLQLARIITNNCYTCEMYVIS